MSTSGTGSQTIRPQDRNLDYLKATVEKIYAAVRDIEAMIYGQFPHITPQLAERITFVHAEDLLREFPTLTPKEREAEAGTALRGRVHNRYRRTPEQRRAARRPRS